MGKRSDMERIPKDFYPTPVSAVAPLVPFLPERKFTYGELCAGDGQLIRGLRQLAPHAELAFAMDIDPQGPSIRHGDCLEVGRAAVAGCDLLITNPPFLWGILKGILDLHPTLRPTWLLLPADFAFNKRSVPYMAICTAVVPVGRVKWFPDSKHASTDNFAWFCFDANVSATTTLHPRAA